MVDALHSKAIVLFVCCHLVTNSDKFARHGYAHPSMKLSPSIMMSPLGLLLLLPLLLQPLGLQQLALPHMFEFLLMSLQQSLRLLLLLQLLLLLRDDDREVGLQLIQIIQKRR